MTDKVDWRDKYRTLALEMEQYEQKGTQSIQYLHSLVTQIDIAVHGQLPQLDQQLALLLTALNTGRLDKVPALLRNTERHVRQLDEARVRNARQLISRIEAWASTLQQSMSDNQVDVLQGVRQRLSDEGDNTQHLPQLIDTLLGLQRQCLHTESDGIVDDDGLRKSDIISTRLAKQLLGLIQQFNVPPQYRERTHLLLKKLETGPDILELESCLEEASSLARLCGGSVEADIQEYLAGLNDQLSYLRRFLESAETSEIKQRKRNNLLDQTVRQDVQAISQTVRHSTDINELKQAVNTQLESLVKAINGHKKAEDQHIAELQRERHLLLSRLSEMELRADQLRASAEEAHLKSRIDPLTGLANRFAYDQHISNELERYQRYGTPFSICVVDIDFFKRINDEYGHLAGDKVLRLMAKVLGSSLRNVDLVSRFGGEEFVILMPSTDAESACKAAEKVRKAVEQSPFNFQSRPVQITISIGVAEVNSSDTAETLFGRADSRLYEAKRNGRNQVIAST